MRDPETNRPGRGSAAPARGKPSGGPVYRAPPPTPFQEEWSTPTEADSKALAFALAYRDSLIWRVDAELVLARALDEWALFFTLTFASDVLGLASSPPPIQEAVEWVHRFCPPRQTALLVVSERGTLGRWHHHGVLTCPKYTPRRQIPPWPKGFQQLKNLRQPGQVSQGTWIQDHSLGLSRYLSKYVVKALIQHGTSLSRSCLTLSSNFGLTATQCLLLLSDRDWPLAPETLRTALPSMLRSKGAPTLRQCELWSTSGRPLMLSSVGRRLATRMGLRIVRRASPLTGETTSDQVVSEVLGRLEPLLWRQ